MHAQMRSPKGMHARARTHLDHGGVGLRDRPQHRGDLIAHGAQIPEVPGCRSALVSCAYATPNPQVKAAQSDRQFFTTGHNTAVDPHTAPQPTQDLIMGARHDDVRPPHLIHAALHVIQRAAGPRRAE